MNRSIFALLTPLLLSTVLSATVYAQTRGADQTSFNPYVSNQTSVNQVNPFDLAYLAYRGYLKDYGIPSNAALMNAITNGSITAQDLMQAAVKAHQLSEETLSDRGYRWALEDQLQGLIED